MIQIKDKTFAITGGTSEIGRALSVHLTRLGADVAIIDKNPEKAQRLIDEINEQREVKEDYGRAAYIEADITKQNNAKEAMSRATEAFGGIDVFISGLFTTKFTQITSPEYLEDFERLVDVNCKSTAYCTHAVVPFMKGRKKGKIIFLLSDMVRFGGEFESLNSISRGGIVYFAKSLARELAASNITVNCVSMGPTEEYLLSRDPSASSIKQAEEKLKNIMPFGKVLRGDDIANTIAFLASPQADLVTGQTWAVNGGLTMF